MGCASAPVSNFCPKKYVRLGRQSGEFFANSPQNSYIIWGLIGVNLMRVGVMMVDFFWGGG